MYRNYNIIEINILIFATVNEATRIFHMVFSHPKIILYLKYTYYQIVSDHRFYYKYHKSVYYPAIVL